MFTARISQRLISASYGALVETRRSVLMNLGESTFGILTLYILTPEIVYFKNYEGGNFWRLRVVGENKNARGMIFIENFYP